MSRPYIICHMVMSLDGRLLPERWPVSSESLMEIYESVAARLGADGWIIGRNTMQHFLKSGAPRSGRRVQGRYDRLGEKGDGQLAICFDREGRLRPETGDVDGDHLVVVVSEAVTEACVEELNGVGASVFFCDDSHDAIADVLARIAAAFGIRRLLLEGGGIINGGLLSAGVIDEASTIISPVIDGKSGIPSIYDRHDDASAKRLDLISTESLADGYVWLRHQVRSDGAAARNVSETSSDRQRSRVLV
ncbi:dihydrofolate reductase family protein [Martelella endophytica]|uniref:Riboflavin deaminase n=1 Tax=Martelella endophytica TaxID=1486262 RepID=A0A0D5LR67_MAREN|nr:dihydrofolate reductase family protein [Martelella endophytica]AJY46262.1 riboflavin deaminase [Martelella endophytica]